MATLPPIATAQAIYRAYEQDADDGFRPHLGASIIGKECERALWMDFRWVTRSTFGGRMLRLFETGHLEEARLVRNLRRVGVIVHEVDPETGRQWRVEAHGGHFGGSLDGAAIGLLEAPKTWHVCEFKTHNAKSFKELAAKGVKEAKPQHFAQMQIYMHLIGMPRAFYLAVNKDTDELYAERIQPDGAQALRLLAKAKRIIESPRPPAGVSLDSTWWQCNFCEHHACCHGQAFPEINCRTCLHSTPNLTGGWRCAQWDQEIPETHQRQGCDRHLFIPDLVPGEQMNADPAEGWVEYQLVNGSIWRNEERHQ